jgi:pimeloyl-ACP methyl ester carboxylesterase
MNIEENSILINGLNIHYLCAGKGGSPVLLLHGAGADSANLSWGDLIRPLAESGHRVIAPDLPGYGESDRPDIAYDTDYYLHFCSDFCQTLGLNHISLMGLSMGGALSIGMALNWPELVNKLVLVDSYGIQRKVVMHFLSWLMVITPGVMEGSWALARKSKSNSRWLLGSIFHDPSAIPDSLLDLAYGAACKPFAGRAFTNYQRSEMTWNGLRTIYLDRLNKIHTPTLIVHGRCDVAVPVACAEDAHRLIAGSQLDIIEGAGHWSQREKPEEFRQVVVEFLKDDDGIR